MYLSKSPRMLQWLLRRAMLGGASNLAMQSPNGFSFGGGGVIMNIESCREFIELAQCLNFTEAAGNLNICLLYTSPSPRDS